jgi:hypothetical protein
LVSQSALSVNCISTPTRRIRPDCCADADRGRRTANAAAACTEIAAFHMIFLMRPMRTPKLERYDPAPFAIAA